MEVLWFTIAVSIAAAVLLSGYRSERFGIGAVPRTSTALLLLGGGLALRWWAIGTLGRLFTVNVAVFEDHHLVANGPYRFVRHPSYTGMLLAFLGLGVFFGSWLSLAALIVPIGLASAYRIHVEEAMLFKAFGGNYSAYCARTKRLVPGVF